MPPLELVRFGLASYEHDDELFRRNIDGVNRTLTGVLAREIHSRRIWSPGESSDPLIEIPSYFLFASRLSVVQHQAPAVALVSRTLLRAIGDVLPVRRIERSIVRRFVLSRDVLRRRKHLLRRRIRWKIHRHSEQIVVGRNRRLGI